MTLFEPFEHVPWYPLVFPIFWGAFALFLVVIVRRLRVFTAVHADGGPAARAERGTATAADGSLRGADG